MRPGYLGKWIEFASINCGGNDDIIQYMRERFLKPSLERKAAIFQKEIEENPGLAQEQANIEQEIQKAQQDEAEYRAAREAAEVAAAVQESNPNDFSDE